MNLNREVAKFAKELAKPPRFLGAINQNLVFFTFLEERK